MKKQYNLKEGYFIAEKFIENKDYKKDENSNVENVYYINKENVEHDELQLYQNFRMEKGCFLSDMNMIIFELPESEEGYFLEKQKMIDLTYKFYRFVKLKQKENLERFLETEKEKIFPGLMNKDVYLWSIDLEFIGNIIQEYCINTENMADLFDEFLKNLNDKKYNQKDFKDIYRSQE